MGLPMTLCLMAGTFFIVVAAVGILRMPDIYMRTHATTKAGTVGLGLTLLAAALFFKDTGVTSRIIGIMLFIIMTTPVAAHMLGKIILTSTYKMWKKPDR